MRTHEQTLCKGVFDQWRQELVYKCSPLKCVCWATLRSILLRSLDGPCRIEPHLPINTIPLDWLSLLSYFTFQTLSYVPLGSLSKINYANEAIAAGFVV